jgi:hypothetical protein
MYSQNIKQLNEAGYLVINDFISDEIFNQFKIDTNKYLENSKNKNFKLTDYELNDSIFNKYYVDSKITNLVNNIFKVTNINFKNEKCYRVFRALVGKESNIQNKKYHFDSYYLTLLFPIIIPKHQDTKNGDFYIIPNIRKIYKNFILNLLVKFLFQNKISYLLYKTKLFDKIFKPIKIIPKEKSVIIFWGYKSLHGSGDLGINRKRITLLYHFKKMK